MRIREKLIENLPSSHQMLKATDEVAILNKELNKKRNIMPLRKLFKMIPNLLMRLKPCLMMSPLSVSYFLETEAYHFDLVVFDEASQIFPEDAIGAIFRGSQVIIVGDSKQLPPTNFFASSTNNIDSDYDIKDEEDFSEVVSDSILEESASVLPNRTLLWHYRSKHENLIAFSNREIYKNNLITFPNSINNVPDMGVEYIYVEDGVYDRGGKKNNIREAEECVKLVFEHIDKHPERSLGIIAFSESQQSAIENAIIDYRERHPFYEWFFDESRDEPFFVKNLENVQGDERDTIIFSICYGKDKNGAMYMNFGPVGHSGGERRLNVAVTRAKCNIKLVGSILPSDIDINRAKSEGARMLRSYIEYARKGTSALRDIERAETFESEDDFCEVIANFLEKHGYLIERQVGCSDYKIDIAVKNPNAEGEFIAGIECDGLSYIHAKTARDRDHLRRSVLQNMGWNLYRVWSTEWSRNPKAEEQALLDFLHSVYDNNGNVIHSMKQSNAVENNFSLETIASESNKITQKVSSANPYGFAFYNEANWWEAKHSSSWDNLTRISENIYHIVKIEEPIHLEMLYKRMGPSFTTGKATETVKRSIDQAIAQKLNGQVVVDKDRFVRLFPLSPIVARIPKQYETPRPIEYIHTEEVAMAMIKIIKRSFGITEDDLASECARAFGFERKGPKIKAKTDAAIKFLVDNQKIRIIDGKAQLIGV
jgi:very-short-patch-repair endonuclease